MTNPELLAACGLVLEDLGPIARWSIHAPAQEIIVHGTDIAAVYAAGGKPGHWYAGVGDEPEQRNVVVMMHGIRVVGIEREKVEA